MAKVLGPLHSSEARGAVGSLVYNSYRGSATVKARSGPGVYNTTAQLAARALTAACTAAWQALTDAQRALWDDFANNNAEPQWTGSPMRLSGYNWYVRINVRRQIIANPIASIPPDHVQQGDLDFYQAIYYDPDTLIEWDASVLDNPGQYWVQTYWTGQHSPGAKPRIKLATLAGTIPFEDYTLYMPPVGPGTYTAFGRLLHGSGLVGDWHMSTLTIPP